jgi:phage head maturation protease
VDEPDHHEAAEASMRTQTKELALAIRSVDAKRRRIVGVASQEIEDRMGDVVVARGIDTRDFMKNPVLLADHDHTFVLGTVRRWWVEARAGVDTALFEADVLPAGTSPRIDERWTAIEAGAANGISIGFLGQEVEERRASTGRPAYRFTKTALLELSQVAVPACQTCLIEQRAMCPHGDGMVLELADEPPGIRSVIDRYARRPDPVVIEIENDDDDYLVLDLGGRRQTLTRRDLERIVDARVAKATAAAVKQAMAQARLRRRQRP